MHSLYLSGNSLVLYVFLCDVVESFKSRLTGVVAESIRYILVSKVDYSECVVIVE